MRHEHRPENDGGPHEALWVLRLAAERGLLSKDEARRWAAELKAAGEAVGPEWLAERGVLTARQVEELRQAAVLAGMPTDPAAAGDAPSPLERHVPQIPGYRITKVLGSGGMGVVYRAWQEHPRREVALKVLRARGVMADADRLRLEREAQAAADLSHPGIVTVYEFGETQEQAYFSMELVDGMPLHHYVAQEDLPVRAALRLMQRICEAVAYAHQRGVIHRDLKPANIMVDDRGEPKLLDFGLARLSAAHDAETMRALTLQGQVLGTIPYMAPEQTVGQPGEVDVRSDVYALGVILYEILTGQLPHDLGNAHPLEAMRRIREEPPRRPTTLSRDVGSELETIILKALEKEKDRRYQSADALGADIGRFLAGEPIEAKRASAIYQIRKLAWRHRGKLIPALVIVLAGMAAAVYVHIRTRADRARALQALAETRRARSALERQGYVLRVSLADAKVGEQNFVQAEEVLEGCPEQMRRWEWHYLMGLCHPELATFGGEDRKFHDVAFSPDGRSICACGTEGLTVWDAQSIEVLRTVAAPRGTVDRLAWSPTGELVAAGGDGGGVQLWDARTWKPVRRMEQPGEIWSIAFSADGHLLATGAHDGTLRTWDVYSGVLLHSLKASDQHIKGVAFSPLDNRVAAAGGMRRGLSVWNATTGELLFRSEWRAEHFISVAFSPDGRLLAAGKNEGYVELYDAADMNMLWRMRAHEGWVNCLAFSADGQTVVSGSGDKTVKLLRAENGEEIKTLKGHSDWVWNVAVDPDGQRIVSQSQDGFVKLWEPSRETGCAVLRTHAAYVNGVAFAPDVPVLASAGYDRKLGLWDATMPALRKAIPMHPSLMRCAALGPGARRAATGHEDGVVRVWDTETGAEVAALTGHSGSVAGVDFDAAGGRIVSCANDGLVCVWDARTGRLAHRLTGHSGPVRSVRFAPDGRMAVSGGDDRTVQVWDVETGRRKKRLTDYGAQVIGVDFGPRARLVAAGGAARTVMLWDVRTGAVLRTLKWQGNVIYAVSFSSDGRRIVSSDTGGELKLWDIEQGRGLLTLKGHTGEVRSVRFSSHGRWIASGSTDRTVRLWDAGRAFPLEAERGPAGSSGPGRP